MRKIAAIALCFYAAGCTAPKPDIATCIEHIESVPLSEHAFSSQYKERVAYSLISQDPDALYNMMARLPQNQKQQILETYVSSMSAKDQLKLTGNICQEKATGLFNVVKDYLCPDQDVASEDASWDDMSAKRRQQSYQRLQKMIRGE